jgi:hypothetical protein
MSNKITSGTFERLSKSMDDIAREIGGMNPDEPVRAERLREICALSQLRRSLKSERNKRMAELAREIVRLAPGHPRRAGIVNEILRLSELISK